MRNVQVSWMAPLVGGLRHVWGYRAPICLRPITGSIVAGSGGECRVARRLTDVAGPGWAAIGDAVWHPSDPDEPVNELYRLLPPQRRPGELREALDAANGT